MLVAVLGNTGVKNDNPKKPRKLPVSAFHFANYLIPLNAVRIELTAPTPSSIFHEQLQLRLEGLCSPDIILV